MTKQRYIPSDNQWVAHTTFDEKSVADAIYDEVGAKFPMRWDDGEPIIDFADLPDGVRENDVKQAVRDHHPGR